MTKSDVDSRNKYSLDDAISLTGKNSQSIAVFLFFFFFQKNNEFQHFK